MSQFSDTFPGSSLDAAKWNDGSVAPATSTVSGGSLTIAGNGGGVAGTVKTVNHYDLVAAGANGIIVTVSAEVSGNSYVAFVDSSNNGYAFHFTPALQETGSWTEPPSFSGNGDGVSRAFTVLLRFAINGSNIEAAYSTNGGSSWTVQHSVASSGFNTGQVYVRLYTGTSTSLTVDDVTIAGSGAAAVKAPFRSLAGGFLN